MALKLSALTDDIPADAIQALAHLRIAVFREWPYLYEGHLDYEADYLRTFAQAEGKILVIVRDGAKIVGASTGLPLRAETDEIRGPWEKAGHDIESIFYFGESVLLPEYRGQGWGRRFFEERETQARRLPGMERMTFCGVIRPDNHPLRPAGYQPLDTFWRNRGFQPTELYCRISWRDIDQPEETDKPLRFWEKTL
ncbi:MAG: GNAT family N-acetyltransferase [Lewinella sp.]|nr:GNAT family N-acetyltransferase [Lewinella sp.]